MTRTDTSLIGALLDRRYRVDSLLARGGMSAVYRGVDTRLDRPVAIKVMDRQFADDRSFVERFEREARSAARLHHPHVVAVHDQGVDSPGGSEPAPDGEGSSRAFLIMELVDGGTLRDLMDDQGPLDLHLALSVIEPVLAALSAAHAAGLVHRDVKPENVLIGRSGGTGSGVVKVGDFGLVRAMASAGTTSSSVILGTVAYLSPEQVTTGSTGARGDVYSAGILLYEMLTGQAPYTGDTAISVAYRHVNDDVPAPSTVRPGIPPAVDSLVLRATRRDPQSRPADAAAFLAEVNRIRTELGIEPVPVPVPAAAEAQTVTAVPAMPADPEATTVTPAVAPVAIPDAERTVPAFAPVARRPEQPGPRGTMALSRAEAGLPPAEPTAPAQRAQQGGAPPQPPTKNTRSADQPRRSNRWIALWVVVGLLLVGGIGTGIWWFNGGRWVTVPDVAGLQESAAETAIREAQLVPTISRERHNSAPIGTVIRSDPGTGAEVLIDEAVTLVVSAGRPTVPAVEPGTPPEQAEQAIREAQLEPRRDPNADAFSADVPEGTVLSLSPNPGTPANIGDSVTIGLSKGPPPTPVPDVTGQSKDDAFKALTDAGFEPFEAGAEFSEDVPAGSVIRTDPGAGTTGEQRVGVYLSNAVEVPMVLGRSLEDAVKILGEAGLEPDVKGGGEGRGNRRFSFVVDQDPSPGTKVKQGSKVKIRTIP
ncbi:serine/threonine protein kinase [Amycolatopsis marina]|uniref:non-specific serine/threonine protein kinase n=1 Tax=Amycolatopsis marina TaxID=490629 RepID=A0A1I1ALP8_9PSEU|nr:Stk1 family PASTA domain-containing Ser/Thr kinase [Amycolatopsis marina]SFB37253.1 serine/threonine protein kinase [Amycolatopsis marina]